MATKNKRLLKRITSNAGRARMQALNGEERRALGQKAARARWGSRRPAEQRDAIIYDEATGQPLGTEHQIDMRGITIEEFLKPAPTTVEAVPRKPIKPGTNEARLFAAMTFRAGTSLARSQPATTWAFYSGLTTKETSRALNSLRAGGHVVSEGGRIKMWKLAT